MKLRGKYIKYLIKAFGVNFANGFFTNVPNLAIGSVPPLLISLPPETKSIVFFDTRTPSKVSTSASSMRNVLERMVKMVEDSDRTRIAAVSGASGPEVIAMTANCGR